MAKALYKLMKQAKGEQADIAAAGKKRGLWGSIGMGLGGLLAMGLTGGAAAPAIAGLMSAGGTYAGGRIGDWMASKTKGGKIKGGRFFQGSRESLVGQLKDKIGATALKSGLTAGMTQFKALGGLKEGGGIKKIFERGPGGQTEGFGKLFDFKGSAIGERMDKIGSMMDLKKARKLQAGEGLVPSVGDTTGVGTGKLPFGKGDVPDLESLFQDEMDKPAIEGLIDQDVSRAKVGQIDIDPLELRGGPSADFPDLPDVKKVSKVSMDTPMYKTGLDLQENTYGGFQRALPGGETGYTSEIPLGKGLSADEQLLRTDIEKSMDWRAAGRPGLEDSIAPSEFRGRPSADLPSLPGRGDYADPTELIPGSGRTPTSYGGGMDETRMTTEDWKSAIPSDAGTINPSELRRSSAAQFTPEKIDLPKMKPMYNKQVLKKDLEDTFSIGTTTYRSDLSPYGLEGGGYTAPERSDTPDWWNRLFGDSK